MLSAHPIGQEADTKLVRAYYARGLAYRRKGDYHRAIQDYDQALKITPTYTQALYARGLAYMLIGDPDRALQDYDQALQVNPNYAEVFVEKSQPTDIGV